MWELQGENGIPGRQQMKGYGFRIKGGRETFRGWEYKEKQQRWVGVCACGGVAGRDTEAKDRG